MRALCKSQSPLGVMFSELLQGRIGDDGTLFHLPIAPRGRAGRPPYVVDHRCLLNINKATATACTSTTSSSQPRCGSSIFTGAEKGGAPGYSARCTRTPGAASTGRRDAPYGGWA